MAQSPKHLPVWRQGAGRKLEDRMDRLDSRLIWIPRYGLYTYSHFTSKSDRIMSKYRPIAPKPTLHTPNSYVDSSSMFSTPKGNNTKCSFPIRTRRRVSGGCNSPSPKSHKRAIGCKRPSGIASQKWPIVGTLSGRIVADCPKIASSLNGSSGVDKLSIENGSGILKGATENCRSVLDKKYGEFEGIKMREAMNLVGDVSFHHRVKSMGVVPLQRMLSDTKCGGGSPYEHLVFPTVNNMEEEGEKWNNGKNLITLPLLPESPALRDSVMASATSNCISASFQNNEEVGKINASCDKEDIQIRLFGRDFSIRKAGHC